MSAIFPAINSEIKTPFRWYNDWKKRNQHKMACEGQCTFGIKTPIGKMLPFQLYRNKIIGGITGWIVTDLDGNVMADLAADISLLEVKYFQMYDYFIYKGDVLSQILAPGYYISEITDGTNTWYSEVFQVTCGIVGGQAILDDSFENEESSWVINPSAGQPSQEPGSMCFTNSTDGSFYQLNVFQTFQEYILEIKISGFSGTGYLEINCGDGDTAIISQSGITKKAVIATDTSTITITSKGNFTGCIDYIRANPVDSAEDCRASLRWKQSCGNLGFLYYGSGYENKFYMDGDVEIIQPTSTIITQVTENGEGEQVPDFKRRETEYSMALGFLPWYIVDALYEMCLHDSIYLSLGNDSAEDKLLACRIEANWDTAGDDCFATTKIYFKLDEATISAGCCDLFIEVGEPCEGNEPDIEFSGSYVVCEGDDIIITGANIAAGQSTGNTYSWLFVPTNTVVSTSNTLSIPNVTGSIQGRYTLTITNSLGCSASENVDVVVNSIPVIELVDFTDESSPSACDGTIIVTVTNVTGPFLYSDGFSINFDGIFTGMCAGTYNIEATDGNACNATPLPVTIA